MRQEKRFYFGFFRNRTATFANVYKKFKENLAGENLSVFKGAILWRDSYICITQMKEGISL